MPKFGPIRRGDLIRGLRILGFTGPYSGAKHELMVRNTTKVILPNPHEGDISVGLLNRILRSAGISKSDWEGA